MPKVYSNGIEIAYEEHGSAADPVLLLVQGLGMPLSAWPPTLIELLVADGFRVITFDNRDIGQSTLLDDLKTPNMLLQHLRSMLKLRVNSPYQLTDMMLDVEGVLDALNIDSAHVVGASMGGMIAQLLAIHAPHRVKTLTSIMSTTGNRKLPGPKRGIARHIVRGPGGSSDAHRYAFHKRTWGLIGSPEYPMDDEHMQQFLQRIFERGMTAAGTARQTLAILAAASRVPELRKLDVPTLIIHGEADPLVPVECGYDTASAIRGSSITTIPGMGHDLPEPLLPGFSRMITEHAKASGP